MGPWGREAIEVFCVTHLITCALDADEENIMMDFHFSVRARHPRRCAAFGWLVCRVGPSKACASYSSFLAGKMQGIWRAHTESIDLTHARC
eukprot:878640-Pelagomonas_calceolata.AAC.2